MSVQFRDRLKTTISNTPGTSGNFTISSAVSTFITFVSGDDALTFDIIINEGTSWEIRKDCTYTNSGTSLSRGTLVSSSTGSAISFTSAAILANTLLAQRTVPFTITTPTSGQILSYNGTNWVNSTPAASSSTPDYVAATYYGAL